MIPTVPESFHARVGWSGFEIDGTGQHAIPLGITLVVALVAVMLLSRLRR